MSGHGCTGDYAPEAHGGFVFAGEYDVERKFRETRLYQVEADRAVGFRNSVRGSEPSTCFARIRANCLPLYVDRLASRYHPWLGKMLANHLVSLPWSWP